MRAGTRICGVVLAALSLAASPAKNPYEGKEGFSYGTTTYPDGTVERFDGIPGSNPPGATRFFAEVVPHSIACNEPSLRGDIVMPGSRTRFYDCDGDLEPEKLSHMQGYDGGHFQAVVWKKDGEMDISVSKDTKYTHESLENFARKVYMQRTGDLQRWSEREDLFSRLEGYNIRQVPVDIQLEPALPPQ